MGKAIKVRGIGFTNYYTAAIQLSLIIFFLYLTSLHSYLLFHSLVEVAGVVIAGVIFVIVWNTRRYIDSGYFLFLGIAFLFIGVIALLHLLSYKGMVVFPGNDSNLPTQLWVAGRYLTAVSFLLAPVFIKKKVDVPLVIIFYSAVFSLLLLSIFYWKNFPVAYIEDYGLTRFKKDSEYVISFLFGISALLVYTHREHFSRRVRQPLILSLVVSVAAEIFFTEYVNVYGSANLLGHLFLVTSFYMLYLGIIEVALRKPSWNLYRNLSISRFIIEKSRKRLRRMNDILEEKVRDHTYSLQKTNEKLNARNLLLRLAAETNSRKHYLAELTNLIKSWTGCSSVGIRVVNEDGNIPYNSSSGFTSEFLKSENWLSLEESRCICTRVMKQKPGIQDLKMISEEGSFCCNDMFKFESEISKRDKKRFRGACARQGFLSLGVIPIWHGRKVLGLIHVADKKKGKLSNEVIEFLESLSSLIGTSINKFNTKESLEKSQRALRVLGEGNRILIRSQKESDLLKNICEMIVDLGGYTAAWVGYPNDNNGGSVLPVAQAGVSGSSLKELIGIIGDLKWKKGSIMKTINTGKTQVRHNIQTDPNYSYMVKLAVEHQFKSSIVIPLKNDNTIFGALTIYAKESIAFDGKEIKLLEELADDMAFGINNLRMRKAKERSERQLIESYQHLGFVNRRISALLDMEKSVKNKENAGSYVLKTAMSLSKADLGLLYKFDSEGNFRLTASRGVGKKIDAELKLFNINSHDFLKPLAENITKLEIRSEMHNLSCFSIENRIRCYLIIPLSKKETGRLKGAIFLGYTNNKKLFDQELEFYDVFEKHASSALLKAKVI